MLYNHFKILYKRKEDDEMTYIDELILKKREEMKKEKFATLEEGMYLDGRMTYFERKDLLDALSIMLPDSWKQMPEEYARIKYPSEFRPKIIITTADLSVNLGFTVFPGQIQVDDAAKTVERMRAAIHRSNPDYLMYPCNKLQDIQGSWFAFRSHAMDSDLYNMMMIASVGKKTVQGSFNCLYNEYAKWKKMVLLIWNSILELREEAWLNARSKISC